MSLETATKCFAGGPVGQHRTGEYRVRIDSAIFMTAPASDTQQRDEEVEECFSVLEFPELARTHYVDTTLEKDGSLTYEIEGLGTAHGTCLVGTQFEFYGAPTQTLGTNLFFQLSNSKEQDAATPLSQNDDAATSNGVSVTFLGHSVEMELYQARSPHMEQVLDALPKD